MIKRNYLFYNFRAKDLELDIDVFRKDHCGKYPDFLIMNSTTEDIIKRHFYAGLKDLSEKESINYGIVFGVPIAICNKLEDGEIKMV